MRLSYRLESFYKGNPVDFVGFNLGLYGLGHNHIDWTVKKIFEINGFHKKIIIIIIKFGMEVNIPGFCRFGLLTISRDKTKSFDFEPAYKIGQQPFADLLRRLFFFFNDKNEPALKVDRANTCFKKVLLKILPFIGISSSVGLIPSTQPSPIPSSGVSIITFISD